MYIYIRNKKIRSTIKFLKTFANSNNGRFINENLVTWDMLTFFMYLNKCYGPNQPPTHFFFVVFIFCYFLCWRGEIYIMWQCFNLDYNHRLCFKNCNNWQGFRNISLQGNVELGTWLKLNFTAHYIEHDVSCVHILNWILHFRNLKARTYYKPNLQSPFPVNKLVFSPVSISCQIHTQIQCPCQFKSRFNLRYHSKFPPSLNFSI